MARLAARDGHGGGRGMRGRGAPAALLLGPPRAHCEIFDVLRSLMSRAGHTKCSQSGLLRRAADGVRARLWTDWSGTELYPCNPIRRGAGRRARAGLPGAPALLPHAPVRVLGAAAGCALLRRRAHHGAAHSPPPEPFCPSRRQRAEASLFLCDAMRVLLQPRPHWSVHPMVVSIGAESGRFSA